ncbi:MAG TPA: hypothetical protein VLA96_00685, partial [Terriglobales bacterium]|nr:hypothetical protein [Terriglobales bacterium]
MKALTADERGLTRTILCLGLLVAMCAAQEKPTADVIFVNGQIYIGMTVDELMRAQSGETKRKVTFNGVECIWCVEPHIRLAVADDRKPNMAILQAIAVKDGHVMAVGFDDGIKKVKGKNTQVVNLRGKFAMPGFNDAHTHLGGAG